MDDPEPIHSCRCDSIGYCDTHQYEIKTDCELAICQNASAYERGHIKNEYNRRKRRDSARKITRTHRKFFKTKDLVQACIEKIIPQLSKYNISGVIGIPRSGMLPASVISTFLSIPLYTLSEGKVVKCNGRSFSGGVRMCSYEPREGNILVIDDTIWKGSALRAAKKILPKGKYIYSAVYASERKAADLDIFAEIITASCFYEWCFFNCSVMKNCLLDIDGILCPDVPPELCDDGEKYIEYISSVDNIPQMTPSLFEAKGLVTGRLEKYREITEKWLRDKGVRYGELFMYPSNTRVDRDGLSGRDHNKNVSSFKSDLFSASSATIFVESNGIQAGNIAKSSKKMVLYPEEGIIYEREYAE